MNVAWTASHPPGDKLKWKALCGHLMPTEYADYVTFVFGFVNVYGVVTSLYVYVSNVL